METLLQKEKDSLSVLKLEQQRGKQNIISHLRDKQDQMKEGEAATGSL